jgi:hypothetical protein
LDDSYPQTNGHRLFNLSSPSLMKGTLFVSQQRQDSSSINTGGFLKHTVAYRTSLEGSADQHVVEGIETEGR